MQRKKTNPAVVLFILKPRKLYLIFYFWRESEAGMKKAAITVCKTLQLKKYQLGITAFYILVRILPNVKDQVFEYNSYFAALYFLPNV